MGDTSVQEAEGKRQVISEAVEWHMIGHLQRNKVKTALSTFNLIQSLDSVALARELDKEGRRSGKKVRTLIEINLGDEQSKSGIGRDKVNELVERVSELVNLQVERLIAVSPLKENPEEIRPYFRSLKELQVAL